MWWWATAAIAALLLVSAVAGLEHRIAADADDEHDWYADEEPWWASLREPG